MNPFRGHVSCHSRMLHRKLKAIYVRVTRIVIEELIREIEKENCRQKRLWVREWISKRESRGVSALLLKELYLEDPKEFRLCLRLTPQKFESLLEMISPFIHKCNKVLRDAIPARLKLEITLNFLATGNSYRTLQHMFRVSKPSISNFVSEVCEAIFVVLKEFIKVKYN